MGVFQRKSSKENYWYIRYWINGKEKWESVGSTSLYHKRDAEKLLRARKRQKQYASRMYVPPPALYHVPTNTMGFQQIIDNIPALPCVYILGSPTLEYGYVYKIGMTLKDLKSRFKHYLFMPFKITAHCIFLLFDVVYLERKLHEMFHKQCVIGEWFKLIDNDFLRILDLIHTMEYHVVKVQIFNNPPININLSTLAISLNLLASPQYIAQLIQQREEGMRLDEHTSMSSLNQHDRESHELQQD